MEEVKDVTVNQESKNMALLIWIGTIFFGFIPGLIFYLVKKDDAYVMDQAKEALNWSITAAIALVVGGDLDGDRHRVPGGVSRLGLQSYLLHHGGGSLLQRQGIQGPLDSAACQVKHTGIGRGFCPVHACDCERGDGYRPAPAGDRRFFFWG